MDKIEALIKTSPDNIKGKIIDDHIILDIVGEDVHYWSPQLNFRVEHDEENMAHSVVSGLIGPRPAVWTLFIFIYFSVGIAGFFISSFGVSKMMLDGYSNLILALPIAFLFMLTAYGVSKYGETLAKDQIEILKQFVRDAIHFENKDKTSQTLTTPPPQ